MPDASDFEAFVLEARRSPDGASRLLPLLREDCEAYAGWSSADAERMRGFVLASFAVTGLPAEALPAVLEELETGRDPYSVAGAARALHGAHSIPAETGKLIVGARQRIINADIYVGFDRLDDGQSSERVRAVEELDKVAALVNADRPCCRGTSPKHVQDVTAPSDQSLGSVMLEDQDGGLGSFADRFDGRTALLAFFYTRCANPNKCSLTVTKLAQLSKLLRNRGTDTQIAVAGISYDPAFDTPELLRAFGGTRGMAFGENCLLLRTVGPFEPVRDALGLAVGYGDSTVNRHGLDLIARRPDGVFVSLQERGQWNIETVFRTLQALAEPLSAA